MTMNLDYPPGATPLDADELASLIPGHITTQGELNEWEQLNILQGEASLIFWLPSGVGRFTVNSATDAVGWRCAAPHSGQQLDFGRLLWGEAHEYPQEILLHDGAKPAGLFHLRIT
ncbi:MAG: hypothetical protein WC029_09860 [Sulfuricella sp.]|jgi:hypothetical protein